MTGQKRTTTINEIGVAVDVGSTSIGVCCVDLVRKTEILSFSFANPQYIYGADVVTRIKHCVEDSSMLHKMHMLVEEELYTQLQKYLGEYHPLISVIVYSGNTTMLHILRELSLDGLARAPFNPVDLEYAEMKYVRENIKDEYEEDCLDITNIYLPGFSAFVGADILTGAEYLQMGKTEGYELLIDLGTNGELLLLNKERGFATSTACGPVFDHVISGAKYGSESMKVIANCVKRGLIDNTGKLKDALFENGIVIDKKFVVKQENIRNFQLAKGAIYAGIQCLLEKAGITEQDVVKVYISGGLGFYMDKRDAFILKMLPKEFADKIIVSGNTSLEGAKRFMIAEKEKNVFSAEIETKTTLLEEYNNIRKHTESFELANIESFQECYMNSLEF